MECWWLSKRNSKWIMVSLVVLSVSTYGAHTERYLAPLTLMVFLLIDYGTVLFKPGRKFFIAGLLLASLIQIPHLTVIGTPAFWAKQQLAYTQALQPAVAKLPEWWPGPLHSK